MSMQKETIRITQADLFSADVESQLKLQATMRRDIDEVPPQPLVIRILYSSWFYLAVSSGLGALVAWAILEPFFDDNALVEGPDVAQFLLFPTVAGAIGLFLGASEGLMCRNLGRATTCGAVGLGIGFGGGLVALFAAGIIFSVMTEIAAGFVDTSTQPGEMPTGFALLILMMGRAAAWSVASIPAGLGQGLALRDKKIAINGVVGGVLGGMVGGFLFDPISIVLVTDDGQAAASRAVGFTIIGMMVGLFVGLVEGWTKTAWLLMRQGPLAGKQFVLFRDVTILGSSPKAEIYLFKDDAIEPRHAIIHNRGGRFEIEDCNTQDGTYVNGIPIHTHILKSGDQIVTGKTVLEFSVKESK